MFIIANTRNAYKFILVKKCCFLCVVFNTWSNVTIYISRMWTIDKHNKQKIQIKNPNKKGNYALRNALHNIFFFKWGNAPLWPWYSVTYQKVSFHFLFPLYIYNFFREHFLCHFTCQILLISETYIYIYIYLQCPYKKRTAYL